MLLNEFLELDRVDLLRQAHAQLIKLTRHRVPEPNGFDGDREAWDRYAAAAWGEWWLTHQDTFEFKRERMLLRKAAGVTSPPSTFADKSLEYDSPTHVAEKSTRL